ncbi:MAG TPA: protein-glutamine glutaminase family protein [Bacteriovoracaceae bacterium]|nr:protein-glutamine glutaminase family protein [Bacteriovoracaceae bacterium]
MRVFCFLFLVFVSLPVFANTQITSQIHDIDYGNMGDEILVFLKSGHVVKMQPSANKGLLDNPLLNKDHDEWLTLTLDENRYIKKVKISENPEPAVDPANFTSMYNKDSYVPTTVASMEVAQQYHREGRRNPKDSQCFNRAIVWSYEWWRKHSVKSNKILIFFTRTYIRRYDFEWWFHIAPYLHVMDGGKVVERAMDLKYTSRPTTFRKWTDIFMKNDVECPVITKYSEYADFPYTGECFLYRTNMYTYQPADLQMNEAWGYTKSSFNIEEVRAAYLEAFDITL